MEQEWAKWKGYGEEDWLEEDWKNDWGQPGKAFDRYVNMDGQVSLQKLKCMEGSNHKSSGKAEKTGGDKPGEKQDVEGKKKAKKVDNTSGKKRKEPEVQDVQDVEDESDEEPVQPALDQKQQVNAIAKFLRAFKAKGYKLKKHEDITEEMKTQWKKDFPVTDECRYSNYWKRPATGVFLKSEKKDFGSYSVSSELGPFDLRLAASLKAAGLLATRKKKMNNHFRFHSLKKSLKRGGVPFWVFFVTSTQFLSFCLCCSFSEIWLTCNSFRLRWTTSRRKRTTHVKRTPNWVRILTFWIWGKPWRFHVQRQSNVLPKLRALNIAQWGSDV